MKISIPIYVEERRDDGETKVVVRPLFFPRPTRQAESLTRAVSRLASDVRNELDRLRARGDQEELSRWSFAPEVEEETVAVTIETGKQRVEYRWLVVALRALGRKVAFTPTIPNVWFEIGRGESLAARAREVFTRHFREIAKRDGFADLPSLGPAARAWTTTLDLSIALPSAVSVEAPQSFAMLGGPEVRDGATELRDVGRCLDWLFPDELDRASGREREVAELVRLLAAPERRPVLLVGPRMAGKTAVVHEAVYRRAARTRKPHSGKENVWMLSPQRLISGMSYVGQWENRLLAILAEARRRDHTLYFDDLVGLFSAGTHSESALGVAHVLKPFLERREARVLAEITPEALGILRELDRGFADLFHVVPVREMNEEDALRALFSVVRALERSHGCRFALPALPAVLDLGRRFGRDAALPGKAAAFLRTLAAQHRGRTIDRLTVLEEFRARSGLAVAFVYEDVRIERASVVTALEREVVGQRAALDAAADAVTVAKARLNDPGRPLASLLFLGPTGVGKTQAAKALARYLFGDADRILRFDMNEFVSPGSAARLVGTIDSPEGLLTSAIRREPFAVVLLDEIEKATPEVFDLLLQALGEGRLTDALGRTADLTNAIVVMTSNLGVREASTRPGFRDDEEGEAATFVRAAEHYFRPEFFNRIDRIVPFERLGRAEVGRIARSLVEGILAREGLARRRAVLDVEDAALERIVDRGFHPTLGARALKRAIERELTAPVAARLAAMRPEEPTVVRIGAGPRGAILIDVEGLSRAEALAPPAHAEPAEALERMGDVLDRIETDLDDARPEGPLDVEGVGAAERRYFAAREQLRRTRAMWRWASDRVAHSGGAAKGGRGARTGDSRTQPARIGRSRVVVKSLDARGNRPVDVWKEILAAESLHGYVRDAFAGGEPQAEGHAAAADVRRELALLDAMLRTDSGGRVALVVRSLSREAGGAAATLLDLYAQAFEHHLDLDVERLTDARIAPAADARVGALVLSGPHAGIVARAETGTHAFLFGGGRFMPVEVSVRAVGENERVDLAALFADEPVARGFPPVIRFYEADGPTVDVRTGLATEAMPSPAELRVFALETLARAGEEST